MDALQRFRRHRGVVGGWLSDADIDVLVAADAAQRALGIRGDAFEIGAYLGLSAILLGALLRDDEVLHVCDLFEAPPEHPANAAESRLHYAGLTRARFEENYRRFHPELPVIHQMSSTDVPALRLLPTFRLVHIDGCHAHDVVLADVATSRELAGPGAIVVFDDYRTEHLPGVAAAVWPAVASGDLVPLAATPAKLYATWDQEVAELRLQLTSVIDQAGRASTVQSVFGYDVLCVEDDVRTLALRRLLPPAALDLVRTAHRRFRLASPGRIRFPR